MKNSSIRLIIDKHPALFEQRVNAFLEDLDKKKIDYKLSYGVCPWRSEGQGGVEFSACIQFGEGAAV